MKQYIYTISILTVIFLIQGCGSKSMTSTLFDINSEYDNDGGIGTIKQTRIITVNPLASMEEVGQVCFLDPKRGSETAVYLDLGIRNKSKKIVKEYKSSTEEEELMIIRDHLIQLDRKMISLVKSNSELLSLELYQKSDQFKAQKREGEITGEEEERLSEKIKMLRGEIQEDIQTLDDSYKEFLKNLRQSNAIIFRWSVEKEKSAQGSAGTIINSNGKSKKSLSGFVLASGLKTERLFIDKTLVDNLNSKINESYKNKTGIITFTLSAENIIYVNQNDLSKMFDINLDVKLSDLAGNSKDILKTIDKIRLYLAAASVENALSGGYLSKPVVSKKEVLLTECDTGKCSEYNNETERRSVFFTVYTKLSELDKLFNK